MITPQEIIDRNEILDALERHIGQRSGIDRRNYFNSWADEEGVKAFKIDYRQIIRDGKEARRLISFIRRSRTISYWDIVAATKHAYSGRLVWNEKARCFNYLTGQYFPTEYRCAVCVVLAAVLWKWCDRTPYDKKQFFKNEFGRGMQKRWFSEDI